MNYVTFVSNTVTKITCWSSRLFKKVGERGPYYLLFFPSWLPCPRWPL